MSAENFRSLCLRSRDGTKIISLYSSLYIYNTVHIIINNNISVQSLT